MCITVIWYKTAGDVQVNYVRAWIYGLSVLFIYKYRSVFPCLVQSSKVQLYWTRSITFLNPFPKYKFCKVTYSIFCIFWNQMP